MCFPIFNCISRLLLIRSKGMHALIVAFSVVLTALRVSEGNPEVSGRVHPQATNRISGNRPLGLTSSRRDGTILANLDVDLDNRKAFSLSWHGSQFGFSQEANSQLC